MYRYIHVHSFSFSGWYTYMYVCLLFWVWWNMLLQRTHMYTKFTSFDKHLHKSKHISLRNLPRNAGKLQSHAQLEVFTVWQGNPEGKVEEVEYDGISDQHGQEGCEAHSSDGVLFTDPFGVVHRSSKQESSPTKALLSCN